MTIAANVNRVLNNARVQLPGAIDDNLKLELFNVMRDFFWQSNAWRNIITVPVLGGQDTYTLTPIDNGNVYKLISLVDSTTGAPVQGSMATPGTLVLRFVPSQAATVNAEVSLLPSVVDSDGIVVCPSWFFDTYQEAITDGLLSQMMAQPAKPYFNERLSIFYARKFNTVTGQARADANRKNLYRAQAWSFPQGFAVRRKR